MIFHCIAEQILLVPFKRTEAHKRSSYTLRVDEEEKTMLNYNDSDIKRFIAIYNNEK